MFGSFVTNTLQSLAPIALDWASEKATQFAQQRLGDLKNITGPALTITNIQQPLKDTIGNIVDIETRINRLQRKCAQKMNYGEKQQFRSRSQPRSSPNMQDEGDWEDIPQKRFKPSEYEDNDF